MPKPARRWPTAAVIVACAITLVVGLMPADAQDATTNGTTFAFDGGGWGHGVGMSQYGAFGRAASGQTHEEILSFYYPGSRLTQVDAPNDLRIHLHSAAGTVVNPTGVVELVDADGEVFFTHRNGRKLTINKRPRRFEVIRPNGSDACVDSDDVNHCRGGEIRIRFVQGEPIKVDAVRRVSVGTSGNRYQWGELAIYDRTFDKSRSTLWVVLEELSMDQYLYGLAEVPASWPSQVLQTQAIAARTYAFDRAVSRRADRNRDEPWDLYSTVDDQVYYGYSREIGEFGPAWTAAVDATSNRVSLYDGDPITAFYSSSNGGWSEDSGYVFVTSLPYLRAQRDRHDGFRNPYGRWSRDYTGDEIGTWLAGSSLGSVGSVVDIQISGNVGASGRVDRARVTIVGTDRTITTDGNRFRNALNGGIARAGGGLSRQLLSTNFEVTVLGGRDPVGAVDRVKRRQNSLRVVGWVFDPDLRGSIDVEIQVDGRVVRTVTADLPRFDIDAVFGEGHSHGFDAVIPLDDGVKHQVCVYAENRGPGDRMLLGCKVA